MAGPWRPARIKGLPVEAEAVINQLLRETNGRIDNIVEATRPYIKSSSMLVFGTVNANTTVSRPVHILGANSGGVASVQPAQGLHPGTGLIWSAAATGKDTVTVYLANPTTSNIAAKTLLWNIVVHL